MNEELNKQLAVLAQKLGTSVEHLWSVLVRQAYIDGATSLLAALACLILVGVAIYGFGRINAYCDAVPEDDKWRVCPIVMRWVFFVMVLIFLFGFTWANTYWVISDFFNPEYYALTHLPHG